MYITIIYLFISQFLDGHEITSHATRNRGGGAYEFQTILQELVCHAIKDPVTPW